MFGHVVRLQVVPVVEPYGSTDFNLVLISNFYFSTKIFYLTLIFGFGVQFHQIILTIPFQTLVATTVGVQLIAGITVTDIREGKPYDSLTATEVGSTG